MQIVSVILSIIAIVSYYYVGKKQVIGIYGWIISNTGMLILGIIHKDIGQVLLWIAYDVLNVKAIIEWRKQDAKN